MTAADDTPAARVANAIAAWQAWKDAGEPFGHYPPLPTEEDLLALWDPENCIGIYPKDTTVK